MIRIGTRGSHLARTQAATVAGIDYARIAKLANDNGVPFERLARRAERGAITDDELFGTSLRRPSENWLTLDMLENAIGMSKSVQISAGLKLEKATGIAYFGCAWKSRSRKQPGQRRDPLNVGKPGAGSGIGRRGCGVLLYKPDLMRLAEIRRAVGLSWINAGRVMIAMKKGAL